jgi:phospholipid/cholesterol/gamma-HCH transport system substrate-binding protein
VGAFVLLVLAMGAAFIYWYSDEQDRRSYQRYEIYFQGSVSGLGVGSPVRYLGVDVGEVKRLVLDRNQPKRVLVIADIDAAAPIDNRTLASLSLQGITGLLFIDLEQDRKLQAPAPLADGTRYPVIRSAPSDLDTLLASLPTLVTRAAELVDHFNHVFSDDNVQAITSTLDATREATARLPATIRGVQELVADTRAAVSDMRAEVAALKAVTDKSAPDVVAAAANLRTVSEHLAETSARLDAFIASSEPSLANFTDHSLPELDQLIRQSRATALELRDLSRSLKDNPSQLLFEPKAHGVQVPP